MPIYEYRCDACGYELDALQKLSDESLKDCPKCAAAELRRLVSAPSFRLKGAAPPGWDFVTAVPAFAESWYSVNAATLADSTISAGVYYSTFLVRAATAVPATYWDSAPDSGYSVDNLEPFAPATRAAKPPALVLTRAIMPALAAVIA